MDINNYIYEEIGEPDMLNTTNDIECQHNLIDYDGVMICDICGITLNGSPIVGSHPVYKFTGYQRKFYFKDKLRLILRKKQCTDKIYNNVVDQLKVVFKPHYKDDLRNLKLFRKKIKKINKKMTKYIFSLYYDCVGKELIKIDDDQYNKLISDFKIFDRIFNKKFPNNKHIFNYNIIIYILFTHNNIPSSRYILLPKNYESTIEKYKDFFEDNE